MAGSPRDARTRVLIGAIVGPLFCAACATSAAKSAEPDSSELAQRAVRFEKAVASPDTNSKQGGAIARWILPDDLKEISGLALTEDGRLFGHGDGHAHVFEIDYRRGRVVKEFTLADHSQELKGDFEAMTIANGGDMFLLASDGKLYKFKEGADSAKVQYTEYDTGLKDECEFESVAFDKTLNSLMLACKRVFNKSRKDSLVIFRWKLTGDSSRAARLSHFTVPLAAAIGANEWDGLHPSDITVDPLDGNYVLIASREKAILEITPAGQVVFSRPLPGEHDQAEGVAITKDSLLIISDEAAGKAAGAAAHAHRVADDPGEHRPAYVTVYRWP
jgi:uncharacterized protein YjiK